MGLIKFYLYPGLAVLCILLLPVAHGHALTLEECVELALKNNPDLQKQQLQLQLTRSDLQEKQGQNFGTISAVSSYTHFNLPRTLVPMTPAVMYTDPKSVATTEDLFIAGIMYEVPLFTGFAQKRSVEIADLQQEMAGVALKLSREQLIYNVRTLYVNVLSLQAQQQAQDVYIKALQRLYDDISLELKLGKRAKVDQLKAAADLERARAQKAQILASLTIVKATLAGLLNVDRLSDFEDIAIQVEPVKPGASGFDEQIKELQRYRSAELEVAKSQKLIEKSQGTFYPQVALNAFYGQNFGPNDDTNTNKGDWEHEEVWQAGVSLKWDIFDFGQRSSKVQMATIARQQSLRERLKIELELKRNLIEAVTRIETAISEYTSAGAELDMTRETENIEQIRFDKGVADLNDLLQAKARNQLARSRFINAGYAYKNGCFYLDYLLEEGETK